MQTSRAQKAGGKYFEHTRENVGPAAPAAAAWIEQNTARGLPAQELYDLVTGAIAAGS